MKARYSFGMALIVVACASVAMAAGPESTAPSGQVIFEDHCAKCHDSFFRGLFKRAPRVGKQKAWAEFISQGVDKMTDNSITGEGRMKERGGCYECSDADMRAAVEYIVDQSQ
jgi:cytochrome c5